MEAICIAEFDQRTKARDQAEKAVKELKDKGNPHKHIVVLEVGYYDCYGLWFFSNLTGIIQQIAAEKFNEQIGKMMHVYLDLEPKKVADGIHPVGVYGNNCLLYKWMAQGYHRGLVVLKDDKAGNMAARIYQESGTWSWMLDDETTARLPVRV
jgi:hypothetical protein